MTLVELEAGELAAGRPEPVRSILSIVSLRLLDGQADIEGAARVAGLGVRGLQRMLRQQGVSYRQVLDVARAARAKALLRETDHSVTEIALDLGYTDHANFTRAFSRWEGCPPNDFRRHVAAFDPGRLAEAGAR
jgi:AraC-like DNA-binding protein